MKIICLLKNWYHTKIVSESTSCHLALLKNPTTTKNTKTQKDKKREQNTYFYLANLPTNFTILIKWKKQISFIHEVLKKPRFKDLSSN